MSVKPNLYRLGECAFVLECQGPVSLEVQKKIWSIAAYFDGQEGIQEVVPGMNNVTLRVVRCSRNNQWLEQLEQAWCQSANFSFTPKKHKISVCYGGKNGPDLVWLAKRLNLTVDQLINIHSNAIYQVFFIGFQPGFAYLHGLDSRLHCARRKHPRPSVPAGSVAIGGSQTGIYPTSSPGGWHLIGQTSESLFDPGAKKLTLFNPGDEIRFIPEFSLC